MKNVRIEWLIALVLTATGCGPREPSTIADPMPLESTNGEASGSDTTDDSKASTEESATTAVTEPAPISPEIVAAVELVEQLEGTIERDESGSVIGIELPEWKATDEHLAVFSQVKSLRRLKV